jgi:hypothetical protein
MKIRPQRYLTLNETRNKEFQIELFTFIAWCRDKVKIIRSIFTVKFLEKLNEEVWGSGGIGHTGKEENGKK